MRKSLAVLVCILLMATFWLTACGEKEGLAQAPSSTAQKDTLISSKEPGGDIENGTDGESRRDMEGPSKDDGASMEGKKQNVIAITNPEMCRAICEELGLKQADSFTEEHLSQIHTVDFSLLRDEDAEWLPYINFSDSDLDFRNNKNITDLRILEGFKNLREWDSVECLWIGSWQDENEAIVSLDGLEYLFGEDGTVLDELRIDKYADMDISALKDIGLCGQIVVNVKFSELLSTWEQLNDIYDRNAKIGTILINVYDTDQNNTLRILDYKLDSHAADVDRRIQERNSSL